MTSWQSVKFYQQPPALNEAQWQWLSDQGSLTQRLRQFSKGQIRHQLRWADWGQPHPEEAQLLQALATPTPTLSAPKSNSCQSPNKTGKTDEMAQIKAWLREITWQYRQQVWVYGRVVIPENTMINTHGRLKSLAHESLGDTLFADPSMRRINLELNCLTPSHFYYHMALNAKLATATADNLDDLPGWLWARRSLFYYQNQPLLIVEIFLPEFFDTLVAPLQITQDHPVIEPV